MGYSTIEHQCNASRSVVKVTIVGFVFACLTLLEGIVCSFAYAGALQPESPRETLNNFSSAPKNTSPESSPVRVSVPPAISSLSTATPIPKRDNTDPGRAPKSSPAVIAANSVSLPEGAIPQTRFFSPVSVSSDTIMKGTRHEVVETPGEIPPRETGLKDAEAENTVAIVAGPDVMEDAAVKDFFQLETSPHTTAEARASEGTSTIKNAVLPEGAKPKTRIFLPQPSSQALNGSIPNTNIARADRIMPETGGIESDLGAMGSNGGASFFEEAANETIAQIRFPEDLLQPQDIVPPDSEPKPELEPFELPPADEVLGPLETPSQPPLPNDEIKFEIEKFEFEGNTAFSSEELEAVTAEFLVEERQTFADIAAAREAVTNLYIENGYATSGAIVPPQPVNNGVVTIEIIEGSLDDIVVQGNRRLRSGYISSRIGLSTASPLNVTRLVERLQLLQSDSLVESISADLQASPDPGKSTLVVSVVEADSFEVTYELDNNRSPSVGTVRNQLRVSENNLLGFGDRLAVGYTLTGGSDGINIDYTVPVSPYDTTLGVSVNLSDSEVIEDPFDVLEIDSESDAYELTLRHPLKRTLTQELAIGLTASHQRTQTALGIDDIGPFPLAPGADDDGKTRVSALRFFQEWTHRSPRQVLALRSQFNVGIGALGATINDDAPDSQFFSWQGQGQWLKLLAPDTPLVVKGSAQLAADSLLSLEQLSLGGQSTVRGYRQNFLSTDNGVSASAEVRFPVVREHSSDLLLQVAPFVDAGYGWNNEGDSPAPIVGTGVGLVFQWKKSLSARLDWGIPLINTPDNRDSLQESGVYFTLRYSFL